MKEGFNLSNNIVKNKHGDDLVFIVDVKEFIKRLKDGLFKLADKHDEECGDPNGCCADIKIDDLEEWIDKLAGEKLK